MQKQKFKDLSKSERVFRTVNLSLNFAIILFLIGLSIYYFLANNSSNRQYACLGVAGFSFSPIIFETLSKKRIPNYLYFFVNAYILFAGVWGSALSGYKNFWWFDIIIHTFMGYFASVVGLFFLCFLKEQNKLKIITVALFCLCFSLFIEGIWELFEYGVDLILPSMEMQGNNFSGQNFPLVIDTMEDLFCNFVGALVFFFQYLLAKCLKKNLLIDSMIDEFSLSEKIKIDEKKIN